MHNPFDQLAKQIGKEALDASGLTIVQREISRDAQHADILHDPDPTRGAERARLGLLGRMAEVLCLLEIFGHTLAGAELRACLGKHFAYWEERTRKARAPSRRRKMNEPRPGSLIEPFLWIVAADVSMPMRRTLDLKPAPGWPLGTYSLAGDLFRVGIVVVSELPRDRSTLLVRIMAAGPRLGQALEDLAALPKSAHEHAVADQVLLNLNHALGSKPSPTTEEQEFIMIIHTTFAEAKEIAWNAGRVQEAARALLTVLRVRGIALQEAIRERIQAEKDPERLERWLEKAAVATSIAEVLDEAS